MPFSGCAGGGNQTSHDAACTSVISLPGEQRLPLRIRFLGNCTVLHCPIQKICRCVLDSEYIGQFHVCDLLPFGVAEIVVAQVRLR